MLKEKKKNKIKSVWKNGELKIVFSEPSIQAHGGVVFAESASDILYYYYTVEVFKKVKNDWKKEFDVSTYDFPALLAAVKIIDCILEDDFTDESWQVDRREGVNGNMNVTWYTKTYNTSSFADEDYYKFERVVRVIEGEDTSEHFVFSVGSGLDNCNFTRVLKCITATYLDRAEIEALRDVMNDFIQKTIDDFNKKERKRIELERKSLKVENGKVYEYRTVYFDEPDNLDSVYIPGDVIDFTTIEKYDGKDIYIDYHNCIIKSVEKSNAGSAGYITVTGGYKNGENGLKIRHLEDKSIKIPLEIITYVFNDMCDSEKLKYTKEQCLEDFWQLLTPEEKKEFVKTPLKKLVKKWEYPVIDRTWMCRDEHGFDEPKKVAKWVVKKMKKRSEREKEEKWD